MQETSFILGLGITMVAVALGYITAKQVSDQKWAVRLGWLVGLSCFAVLQTLASPIREKWVRDECRADYSSAEEIESCVEEGRGPADVSDDDR